VTRRFARPVLPALAIALGLVAAPVARAADAPAAAPPPGDSLFAQAAKDYADRHYDAAIAKYEQLVRAGVRHEHVYYNLGNAYFRKAQEQSAGKDGKDTQLGRAILCYERALAVDPDFEDARTNLDVARELVGVRYGADKVKEAAEDPLWIKLATFWPLRRLAWVFLGLDVLFFGVLVTVRFLASGFLRTGLVVGNVFCGVAGAALGVLLALNVYYKETVHMGVVVADEVIMREGPDASRREMPKLHAGHRAIVLREDHGWLRIRLANKMEGWVPRDTVEQI
jgi:tetratricopeptide (TPR) repeat protein